jgi:hypothetical protein
MLNLDQIQRELRAIREFDILYFAKTEHYPEEILGFELRKLRKQELFRLAKQLALSNQGPPDRQMSRRLSVPSRVGKISRVPPVLSPSDRSTFWSKRILKYTHRLIDAG